VLELDVPYKIKIVDQSPGLPTPTFPVDLISSQAVESALECLRLGLLLSSKREQSPNVVGTWRTYFESLDPGRSTSWNDPRRSPNFVPTQLSPRESTGWGEWSELIARLRNKTIDVAVRRTLMAAADRPDPSDALVDAVIAWENLVGSREGEPTLRVSASLAWLLGRSASDREAVRKRVSALYGTRSDIVHGNKFLDPKQAAELKGEALAITLNTFRAMLKKRPELLAPGVEHGKKQKADAE
jgi:hypothetical protein